MNRLIVIVSIVCCIALPAIPAAAVSVSLSPQNAQVLTGGQLQFAVTVKGTSDSVVIWSVTGSGCSGISCGTISSDGLYTAPTAVPNSPTVTVTATSLADVTARASSTLTIGSGFSVSVAVSPDQVVLATGGQQQFSAHVTGTSNASVTWRVSGIGCVGNSCGSVSAGGLYTAPSAVPQSAAITIAATSVADPTKAGSAALVVQPASSVSVAIQPKAAQVATGGKLQMSATVAGSTNTAVLWTVSGPGCSGAACGAVSSAGVYTAPAILPNPASITIKAAAVSDPSAWASATVTLVAGSSISVSPPSAQVKPGATVQFTASATGNSGAIFVWSISGTGCSGSACGSISSSGLYVAPTHAPNPPTVAVTATLLSDPTKSGSATVTIGSTSVVAVSISPASAQVGVGGHQQFTATVTGSSNTAVTWTIKGTGCAGTTCGTVSSSGLYTAPSLAPTPPFFSITATSVTDSSKSATASITVVSEVSITLSPASAKVAPSGSIRFTAQVSGTPNTSVSWSVSGSGCTGTACGRISSAGLYTAPATIPNPASVTVKATSQADTTKSASAQVIIAAPISVAISPTTALVTVGAQKQFQATVKGTTNNSLTWSLSGAGCTGATCGTITSAGLYTAPASVPNPAAVRIAATSQVDTSQSAVATVTITPTNNSKLHGQYALLFKGFDRSGVFDAAASFIADGNGNITSGVEDVNRSSGPNTALALTGSYQVGTDNRGTLTLKSKIGTFTYAFAMNGTANSGSLMEADSSGISGSGVIKIQDPTSFDPSVFSGGYVISLTGADRQGGRIAAVGSLFPSGAGTIAGSGIDINDAGNLMPTFAPFSGTYDVDSTGHGNAVLSILGFGNNTPRFALYAVSASEYFLVSVDAADTTNPVWAGVVEAQAESDLPFTTSLFNGSSIFDLTGSVGNTSQVTVGRMQFDGIGTIQVQFDQNSGGNLTVGGLLTGAYSVQLNGRGVLTLDNAQTGTPSIWILYATAANQALLLSSDATVASGKVTRQGVLPPFDTGDLEGNFSFGPGEVAAPQASLLTGSVFFDGASTVSGAEDESAAATFTQGRPLAGTYSVSTVSNNGRGVAMLTSPTHATQALWVVSGMETLGVDVDASDTAPTLLRFEQ